MTKKYDIVLTANNENPQSQGYFSDREKAIDHAYDLQEEYDACGEGVKVKVVDLNTGSTVYKAWENSDAR